jgi:hypothetical protein
MIVEVTQVVIIGDRRTEKKASAQIDRTPVFGVPDHSSASAHHAEQHRRISDLDAITQVTRALFNSFGE